MSAPLLVKGKLQLDSPFALAPLAGYTDLPFRLLCREQGAGLVFSEMISSHGLVQGQQKTGAMLQSIPEERPFVAQLFGAVPEIMAEAARRVCDLPVDAIDLNMGCPVRKVTKRGAGAALMMQMENAAAIVRAVCAASSLPVSVKFRSGKDESHQNAVDFARMAEEAGAAFLTIHGRTWAQAFSGEANWDTIRAVKAAVQIPVIGNGDIDSFALGCRRLEESGCDAVMAGRGALGNPWLFAGTERPQSLTGRMPLICRYLDLCQEYLPLERVIFRIKNQVCRFLGGLSGAVSARQQVLACPSLESIKLCLDRLLLAEDGRQNTFGQ